jgi:Xaa-Pro dipeptidase
VQLVKTDLQARLEKLQAALGAAGYDVAAIVPGPTLTYLTRLHFALSKRPLVLFVPAVGEPGVIVPALEMPRFAGELPFSLHFYTYTDAEGYRKGFEKAGIDLAGKKIAVEGLTMRVLEGQLIEEYAPRSKIVSAEDTISAIRLHKDEGEIASMRQAINISQGALDEILPKIKVGMTERQVANLLQQAMTDRGSQGNAFDVHVLTGPKSAQPHGAPADVEIQNGDVLLFDFGAAINGYPADITRVFAVGEIDPELVKVYDIVLAANEAGIRAARPGIAAQDVDRVVRKVITDAGYGEYFIHRTGHGLGLFIHEAPNIVEGNAQILEPGMVFTVEPGIYLPEKGGIRIEDNLVVTEDGAEVLTSYPKTLRTIGS